MSYITVLCVQGIVRDVYYSATVSTIVCITSKHLCIAGPYALSHDLARKNAKFTVKLPATSLVNQPYFSGLHMRARKGGTCMCNPEKYGWFTRLVCYLSRRARKV